MIKKKPGGTLPRNAKNIVLKMVIQPAGQNKRGTKQFYLNKMTSKTAAKKEIKLRLTKKEIL